MGRVLLKSEKLLHICIWLDGIRNSDKKQILRTKKWQYLDNWCQNIWMKISFGCVLWILEYPEKILKAQRFPAISKNFGTSQYDSTQTFSIIDSSLVWFAEKKDLEAFQTVLKIFSHTTVSLEILLRKLSSDVEGMVASISNP